MSPSKNNSHSSSNRNGEGVVRQANILASAYIVDASARLTGFHYSTTGAAGPSGVPEVLRDQGLPSPPSSPPLAALTSANEITLSRSNKRDNDHGRKSRGAKGAAYTIREECERLFCGTMKGVFLGEEGSLCNGSFGTGMDMDNYNNMSMHMNDSPPSDGGMDGYFATTTGITATRQSMDAWIEVWDYAGGCSFRGFVGGDGENKSLFAFFDSAVIGRDLKQGLMALIELAESVFAVTQVVICVDRSASVQENERKAFLKSLRWVGFELVSLDLWAGELDVSSEKWLFLGMEV
ncbi:hypothetical protein LOCC1_G008509 [Lachnellula occidentalis]|uniref:Ornithine decarboxylase antizyme n=1 Tax=Lachnellula occidentalis TaxID=215460 RepID=A0A8H8U5N7_9HELO|nr:hypothetical protein LOCC1_G008509 [Lachnellula occidentalis]